MKSFRLLSLLLHGALLLGSPWVLGQDALRLSGFGTVGYAVDNRSDIAPARDISQKPNFYVSDVRLPGMSGLQFLDALQKRSANPINAVLLTGDTGQYRSEQIGSSQWKVLLKPINLPTLLAAFELDA